MAGTRKIKQIGVPNTVESEEDAQPEVTTMLDSLKDYLSSKIKKDPKRYKVPGRELLELEIDLNFDYETYDRWVKQVTKGKGDATKINWLSLAVIVISNTNVGMHMQGRQETDLGGNPMTVANNELHKMIGVPIGGTRMAIKHIFPGDSEIISFGRKIIEDAGWAMDGDDIEEGGPLDE